MDLNLRNHVAFITGGSSGIGRVTALAFAKEGTKVAIADINDTGEQVAEEIRALGSEAIFLHCDTTNERDVSRAIEQTLSRFGRLDHAFNNAGTEGVAALTSEYTSENWDAVINLNLKGVWLCMKYEIPQMLQQGGGTIVNSSSIAGLVGYPRISAYVASKHGVVGLTKAAALECATSNVRVNAICPGLIDTPMVERFTQGDPEARRQMLADQPIGRIGEPEEVADTVLWLSSTHASLITGHAIAIDGGWVAQ